MHLHRLQGLFAALLAVPAVAAGCSAPSENDASQPPGAGENAAALTGVTFHGKAIRSFDRTMPDVDALAYDLDLRVDEDAPRAGATLGTPRFQATLKASFAATKRVTTLDLDFDGNTIDAVLVGGRAATHTRNASGLHVKLPSAVAAGSAILVEVRYHGALFQADGANPNDFEAFGGLMVMDKNVENRRIYESLNWPRKGRRWIPLRDHPRDGALFAVRATFPEKYTVVSNGKLTSETTNGDGSKSWQWVTMTPMPSYDFHVAAYDHWNHPATVTTPSGIDVDRYVYEKHASEGAVMCGELPQALEYYEATFGPFLWEKASFLETPIFGGGMEHATSVSLDESLFTDAQGSRSTAFHELAHHWSGNLTRIRTWNDFWLSEGFTDYLAGRFIEAHDGATAGEAYWREMRQGARLAELDSLHPLRPADPEIDVLTIFDSISYKKGALVLRMIEARVGRAALDAFLTDWFAGHAFVSVTTKDLESAMTARFGAFVAPFFEAWVYGQGHPELDASFTYDRVAKSATVVLRDVEGGGPALGWPVELDVELREAAPGTGTLRTHVALEGRETRVTVPLGFVPAALTVDPDEMHFIFAACDTARACRSFESCRPVKGENRSVCVPR